MSGELIQRPDFLPSTGEFTGDVEGLEEAEGLQLLNYLRVRADMAKGELKEKFEAGDLIITPSMELVAKKQQKVHIFPLHFFKYAAHQNPYGATKFIIEKTRDPNSPIWKRAESKDQDQWRGEESAEVPGKFTEYAMHLCYVVVIDSPGTPGHGELTILDFAKGEWKYGVMFKKRITTRCFEYKIGEMFANRFAISVESHTNPQNEWWGITTHEPEDGQLFANQEQFNHFKKARLELVAALKTGDLQYADESVPDGEPLPGNVQVDERF